MEKTYDVLIIGGGPAGLSAAIYAARSGVRTAVLESMYTGGVAAATPLLENYPGFASISGFELAQKMTEQAQSFGAELLFGEAESVADGKPKRVTLRSGETLAAKALVLATGNVPRKLGLPGEDEWLGAGLSYCATCDGNFFRGKTVAVAGNGGAAIEAVRYLQPIAAKVIAVSAGKAPLCEGVETVAGKPVRLIGKPLSAVEVQTADGIRRVQTDGLFVCLGYVPATEAFRSLAECDEYGYLIADEKMQTATAGVFVAGDARRKPLRQIATAVSDGAIAGTFAAVYAKKEK